MIGEPGGSRRHRRCVPAAARPGIGAEIMGAGKFGPPGWHEDPEWKGWWGPNPPFHTPTFVLTHHPRPSIEMEGGTTFHFLDASPAEALATAREAAGGQDVRIGGGATTIREFVAAGLIDHMHIVVVPILLGRGVRLWDGLEGLEKEYEIEATTSPSGVTHVTFTRHRSIESSGPAGVEQRDEARGEQGPEDVYHQGRPIVVGPPCVEQRVQSRSIWSRRSSGDSSGRVVAETSHSSSYRNHATSS